MQKRTLLDLFLFRLQPFNFGFPGFRYKLWGVKRHIHSSKNRCFVESFSDVGFLVIGSRPKETSQLFHFFFSFPTSGNPSAKCMWMQSWFSSFVQCIFPSLRYTSTIFFILLSRSMIVSPVLIFSMCGAYVFRNASFSTLCSMVSFT